MWVWNFLLPLSHRRIRHAEIPFHRQGCRTLQTDESASIVRTTTCSLVLHVTAPFSPNKPQKEFCHQPYTHLTAPSATTLNTTNLCMSDIFTTGYMPTGQCARLMPNSPRPLPPQFYCIHTLLRLHTLFTPFLGSAEQNADFLKQDFQVAASLDSESPHWILNSHCLRA